MEWGRGGREPGGGGAALTRKKPLYLIRRAGPGQPAHLHHVALPAFGVQHHAGSERGLRFAFCCYGADKEIATLSGAQQRQPSAPFFPSLTQPQPPPPPPGLSPTYTSRAEILLWRRTHKTDRREARGNGAGRLFALPLGRALAPPPPHAHKKQASAPAGGSEASGLWSRTPEQRGGSGKRGSSQRRRHGGRPPSSPTPKAWRGVAENKAPGGHARTKSLCARASPSSLPPFKKPPAHAL